ncbi:MAG: hypothetical protein ACE5I3_14160 [Phycisphaerae bacterium]
MRRRSRTRRGLKWAGLTLCVPLTLAYVLSAGYRFEWTQLDGGHKIDRVPVVS